MKRIFYQLMALVFLVMAVAGCAGVKQAAQTTKPIDLTVSAAASLKDAAEELKDLYKKKHPAVTITYNFAASGTLQKQIEEGAPVDIFISAGSKQMDALAVKGMINKKSRYDLLSNELVLVAGKDSTVMGFEDLADYRITRISIGAPETVPAGEYARETLTSMGLWEKVASKIVYAKDVRQVLTYVETGNVDAGLVYRSDVVGAGNKARIVAVAPKNSHKPIIYPLAILKNSKHKMEATQFTEFLLSREAAGVFKKYGFQPLKK